MLQQVERYADMTKVLNIGIDLDGVVFRTLDEVIRRYNLEYKKEVVVEQIKGWDTHNWVEGDRNIYKYFNDPEFYRDLPVAEGAVEVLRELDKEHNIYLITDTPWIGLAYRVAQIERVFPYDTFRFMQAKNVFITPKKEMVMLDVLLDDRPENIINFAAAGYGIPVVFDWPLNRHLQDYQRVADWYQFLELIRSGSILPEVAAVR